MKTKRVMISLVLALVLALGATMAPAAAANNGPTPSDIAGRADREAIMAVYEMGGLNHLLGAGGTFAPAQPCNCATFVQLLVNLYGEDIPIHPAWLTDTIATQLFATTIIGYYSEALGQKVSWDGGAPEAPISRGDACGYIAATWDVAPGLKKFVTRKPVDPVSNVTMTPTASGVPSTPNPSNPTQPENPVPTQFEDVSESAYFAAPVAWAVQQGIVKGTSETTFSPKLSCTVSQVLTMLYRGAGSPVLGVFVPCPYGGIPTDRYDYSALRWAGANGLIDNDSIDPALAGCSRAYIVACLWKLAGSPDVGYDYGGTFEDVPEGATYNKAVRWAVANGITTGVTATRFAPMDTVDRAQAVTFLYRAAHPHIYNGRSETGQS